AHQHCESSSKFEMDCRWRSLYKTNRLLDKRALRYFSSFSQLCVGPAAKSVDRSPVLLAAPARRLTFVCAAVATLALFASLTENRTQPARAVDAVAGAAAPTSAVPEAVAAPPTTAAAPQPTPPAPVAPVRSPGTP